MKADLGRPGRLRRPRTRSPVGSEVPRHTLAGGGTSRGHHPLGPGLRAVLCRPRESAVFGHEDCGRVSRAPHRGATSRSLRRSQIARHCGKSTSASSATHTTARRAALFLSRTSVPTRDPERGFDPYDMRRFALCTRVPTGTRVRLSMGMTTPCGTDNVLRARQPRARARHVGPVPEHAHPCAAFLVQGGAEMGLVRDGVPGRRADRAGVRARAGSRLTVSRSAGERGSLRARCSSAARAAARSTSSIPVAATVLETLPDPDSVVRSALRACRSAWHQLHRRVVADLVDAGRVLLPAIPLHTRRCTEPNSRERRASFHPPDPRCRSSRALAECEIFTNVDLARTLYSTNARMSSRPRSNPRLRISRVVRAYVGIQHFTKRRPDPGAGTPVHGLVASNSRTGRAHFVRSRHRSCAVCRRGRFLHSTRRGSSSHYCSSRSATR